MPEQLRITYRGRRLDRSQGTEMARRSGCRNAPPLHPVHRIGHSRGHCAVAVDLGGSWLLHAGDAYFFRDEMNLELPRCPLGLSLFQRVVQTDGKSRRANQVRLRTLAREQGNRVRIFSAHDPVEFEAMARAAIADDSQDENPVTKLQPAG